MSDFDKEAERERLRKKYEEEREDRETTERMSELLLRGATMTNKHCDTCGDPIFRYEGQEFCPTCQAEAEEAQAQAQAQATAQETQAAQGEQEQETQAAQGTPAQGGQAAQSGQAVQGGQTAQETQAARGTQATQPGTAEASQQPQTTQPETTTEPAVEPTQAPVATPDRSTESGAPTGDLAEAQAALASSITSLARRAEQTDDPRKAKELLAAAREAAEAIDALPR